MQIIINVRSETDDTQLSPTHEITLKYRW